MQNINNNNNNNDSINNNNNNNLNKINDSFHKINNILLENSSK